MAAADAQAGDDVGAVAGGGRLCDVLDRAVLRAGVELGDPDQRGRERQADKAGAEERHRTGRLAADQLHGLGEHRVGDEVERDQRQHAGHRQAAVQRWHHVGHAGRGLDEVAADDGRDDRHPAQHQRVDHASHRGADDHDGAQRHGGDQRHRIGLEQIGGHAGAVTHVVAHVVSDHGRVARIVFRNAGFHLAHQVGADVSTFGEDATAQPRKDRNQRRAECQPEHGLEHLRQRGVTGGHHRTGGPPEEQHDADESQADDQHAGDGATLEGDVQCRTDALGGGLRGAHVGAHRDVHADEAAGARQDRPEHEADGCLGVEEDQDQRSQHDADDADGLVLAGEVSGSTLLDSAGDFLHARVAGILLEDPTALQEPVDHGNQAAAKRYVERHRSGHRENSFFFLSFVCATKQGKPRSGALIPHLWDRQHATGRTTLPAMVFSCGLTALTLNGVNGFLSELGKHAA